MRRESHDRSEVVQMATRMATVVQRRFRAAGFTAHGYGDLDDVAQDAALAVVETMASGRARPGAPPTYFYRAAARQAGVGASRALAAVSLPAKRYNEARRYQVRVGLSARGVHLVDDARADQGVERKRRMRANLVAQVRLRRALERHLAGLDRRARQAIEMCLGWDGEISGWDEVVWRLQLPKGAIARAARKLARSVAMDERVREARARVRETTEDP